MSLQPGKPPDERPSSAAPVTVCCPESRGSTLSGSDGPRRSPTGEAIEHQGVIVNPPAKTAVEPFGFVTRTSQTRLRGTDFAVTEP